MLGGKLKLPIYSTSSRGYSIMEFQRDKLVRDMLLNTEEIVAAGYKSLRHARNQRGVYISEKEMFFAGAAFMLDAIFNAMSPGEEPQQEDLDVLTKLHKEMETFNAGFNHKMVSGASR